MFPLLWGCNGYCRDTDKTGPKTTWSEQSNKTGDCHCSVVQSNFREGKERDGKNVSSVSLDVHPVGCYTADRSKPTQGYPGKHLNLIDRSSSESNPFLLPVSACFRSAVFMVSETWPSLALLSGLCCLGTFRREETTASSSTRLQPIIPQSGWIKRLNSMK